MMRTVLIDVFSALLVAGLVSCSEPQDVAQSAGGSGSQMGGASTGPTGGIASGGNKGTLGSGGTNANSTKSTTEGTVGSGGTTTSSGTPAVGGTGSGSIATGGGPAAGGTKAAGGATATVGGNTAAGGTHPGSTSSGGAGGIVSTATGDAGGASSSGGTTGAGGSATGGASKSGTSSSGGATDKGGSTTGGAGKGGATSSGGTTGAGGSATGGSSGASTGTQTCMAATLREAGNCAGRLIGTALSTKHLQDASYTSKALEFDYVTPEDEMKWDATESTRNVFTYTQGEQITDFAKNNGMKVKGHTLVWYNQLPSWVSSITDPNDLRSAMQNHITKVMQHFHDKGVIAWDVVNEAWDDTDSTKLRDSVFSRVLGIKYIDDAFNAARSADSSAKLFYNDYATDGLGTKANSVYDMVKDMKARGIPIDGVGLQMHWRSVGSSLTATDVIANMQRLIDLGLEVVISEMDVQLCKGGTLTDQQARFHDIVAACMTLPKCTAVTFWGITDKYSWLNSRTDLGCTGSETPRPLLWDDSYNEKLAYTGVMDALLGR